MITIHHLESSRSHRVLFLLEFYEIDYQVKLYRKRSAFEWGSEALKEVHPLGRSPTLTRDLENGDQIVVTETGAIFQYVMENNKDKFPKLDEKSRADLLFWMHFAEASLMLHLMPMFHAVSGSVLTDDGTSKFEASFSRGLKIDLAYIERRLSENDGKSLMKEGFGAADILQSFPLLMAQLLFSTRSNEWRQNTGLELGSHTVNWLKKMRAEPAYKRASKLELENASEDLRKTEDFMSVLESMFQR